MATKTDNPIDSIKKLIENKSSKIREKRKAERQEQKRPEPDGEALAMEEAYILGEVVQDFARTKGTLAQTILYVLDQMWQTKAFLIYENETLREWAEAGISEDMDRDYVIAMVNVVERIFAYVHGRKKLNKPVIDSVTGLEVTVEEMIARPGLIQKMKMASYTFENLDKDEKRDKLISDILNGTTESVKKTIKKQRTDKVADTDKIKIYQSIDLEDENLYSISAHGLTEKQLRIIEKALGDFAEFELETGAEDSDEDD